MRNVSEKSADKSKSTHFVSNNFCPENRAVYKHGRAGQASDYNIIRRMRYACWITKATDTHSAYVIVLLLFHANSGYANASQCYAYPYIVSLVFLSATPVCQKLTLRAIQRRIFGSEGE